MHVQDGTIVKYGGVFIKGDLISWKIKTGTLQQSVCLIQVWAA